jgi:glycosyltransferase involved in cell wall biosynthesis
MKIQGLVTRGALALPGWTSVKTQLQWQTFREADQVIVGLEAERRVLEVVYGVPATRITILPLGLDPIYLSLAKREKPGSHLISVGTVCEVKRSVDLAELARSAQVPILFVGNPYSYSGPYWKHFQSLIDNRFVFHRPHITDLASMKEVVSEARGFVLYSIYENWSLAAHEAAACGLPLLLPDTKWARECFTNQAVYLSSKGKQAHALELREFYECADRLPVPKISNYSWSEVAKRLLLVYEGILQRAPSPP